MFVLCLVGPIVQLKIFFSQKSDYNEKILFAGIFSKVQNAANFFPHHGMDYNFLADFFMVSDIPPKILGANGGKTFPNLAFWRPSYTTKGQTSKKSKKQ